MITVVVRYTVKDGKANDFSGNVKKLAEATRQEKGCIFYECSRSDADPLKFVMIEKWESKEDLDAHSASAHFKKYVPEIDLTLEEKALDTYSPL